MLTSFLLAKALPLLLKFLVAPITYRAAALLLNLRRSIDSWHPAAKLAVVAALGVGFSIVAHYTGAQLPAECATMAGGDISDACWEGITSKGGWLSVSITAALGILGAKLLHNQKKTPVGAGAPVR